jgi:uncharacterized protein (DUF1330 family)
MGLAARCRQRRLIVKFRNCALAEGSTALPQRGLAMKCYLFGNVVVTDRARFAEYLEKVPAIIAQYEGRYIVRGGAVQHVEGDLDIQRAVILEFPSRDAALRFYDSPEYAPMLKLRRETTVSQVMFIDAIGADYIVGPDGDINRAVHKSRLGPAA